VGRRSDGGRAVGVDVPRPAALAVVNAEGKPPAAMAAATQRDGAARPNPNAIARAAAHLQVVDADVALVVHLHDGCCAVAIDGDAVVVQPNAILRRDAVACVGVAAVLDVHRSGTHGIDARLDRGIHAGPGVFRGAVDSAGPCGARLEHFAGCCIDGTCTEHEQGCGSKNCQLFFHCLLWLGCANGAAIEQ